MTAFRSATLRRLRQLEDENGGLNRLVADLTLDNRALEVVATRRRLRGLRRRAHDYESAETQGTKGHRLNVTGSSRHVTPFGGGPLFLIEQRDPRAKSCGDGGSSGIRTRVLALRGLCPRLQ